MNTRMLKFAFQFEPIQRPSYKSSISHIRNIERDRIKSILQQSVIELKYNEKTKKMDEQSYVPSTRSILSTTNKKRKR